MTTLELDLAIARDPATPVERLLNLREFAYASELLDALAENPAMPEIDLYELAEHHACAFLKNPALPLLVLTNNPWLDHDHFYHFQSTLIPEAPEFWIDAALSAFEADDLGPFDLDRMPTNVPFLQGLDRMGIQIVTVLRSPATPIEILRRRGDEILSELQPFQHESEFKEGFDYYIETKIKAILSNDALPDDLRLALSMRSIALHIREVIEFLASDERSGPWIEAICSRPYDMFVGGILYKRKDISDDHLFEAYLQETERGPAGANIIERIAALTDPESDRFSYWFQRYQEMLPRLPSYRSESLGLALAYHYLTPEPILYELIPISSWSICKALVRKPECSQRMLQALAATSFDDLQQIASERLKESP
jgi:hypothetical protein